MSCGRIVPLDEGAVEVMVRQVAGEGTRYLRVNRVYRPICQLQDGNESPWPKDDFRGWCPDHAAKVVLFVLVYLWAGCDFLPAVSKLPFPKMWDSALKSVRSPGLFAKPIFVQEGRVWTVDLSEGVKLSFTSWFFLHEAAFVRADTESPDEIIPQGANVEQSVRRIAWFAFTLGKGKLTNCCPPYESLLKHVRRSRSVFHMWQGGKMPKLEFKGEGWGVDPRGKDKDAPLAAETLVIELSEHCYVDTDRKTRLLKCSCDLEKAANDNHRRNRCSCKGKTCSLLCGCKGRCHLGLSPSAVAATDADSEGRDAEGGAGESDGGGGSEGDASCGGAESGVHTLIDISGGGDSGVLGWISSDSDSDHASVADSEVSFDVEGCMGGGVSWADHRNEVDM